MAVKVIDASAMVAVLFTEPAWETTAARINGHHLTAPKLLRYEVANACLVKLRRQPDDRQLILESYEDFFNLEIETIAIEERAVLHLADQTNLTFYDASYLWLGQTLGAELVTLDRKLAAVAARR